MKTVVRTDSTLFPSLPSLLDDFFSREWMDSVQASGNHSGTLPAVNVRETNEDYVIDVAAPGMKRDDFKVELDHNVLTISSQSEAKHEERDEDGSYTRREFNYQSFQRRFTLPENKVAGDKISARYTDGILRITLPKREEAKLKPIRQITIG